MKNLDDFSWKSPKKEEKKIKPKKGLFKIILYFFLWFFCVFFILFIFDFYFFYEENKNLIDENKASLKINISEIKENIKNNNFKEVDKKILLIEKKLQNNKKKLKKYKEKFTFKIFWISHLIWKSEIISKKWVLILKNWVEIKKEYENIFKKNFWKNPIKNIFKEIKKIEKNINEINSEIPFFLKKINNEKVEKYQILSQKISEKINNFLKYEWLFLKILWENSPQTTVFLFQNSNESRATWGFIWSFLKINTNNWIIKKWWIFDIYQFDGQITTFEKSPLEAKKLIWKENWSLRDANVNPNLEISSKYFKQLFEKSWWESIDNFIFINQEIIWDIISILWEIKLQNENLILDKNNYDFLIQYLTESRKNKIISPKIIVINQLLNKIKNKISKNPEDFFEIYDLKNKWIKNKNIQIFSSNEEINFELKKLWIKKDFPKKDFIAPIFVSISWNKSDKFVKTNFEIKKEKDTEFEFNLEINRKFDIPKTFLKMRNNELVWRYSDIPKVELKRILWFWGNKIIFQIYTDKKFKLLFSEINWKNIKNNFWTQWDLNVFEILLPEIFDWENLNLKLYFKSEEKIWEIELFEQSWIK